jgi:chlorite dismutase
MRNRFAFVGGSSGKWHVTSMQSVRGDELAPVSHVDVATAANAPAAPSAGWRIDGQISNLRYATRMELTALRSRQEPLGRPQALVAAMIPIRKTAGWWDLAQDERRAIFEDTSRHTEIGMRYLPAIARQLYHSRDLGEPFDFVTWFEYSRSDRQAFDELLGLLRATREWEFVEREIDIRLELQS